MGIFRKAYEGFKKERAQKAEVRSAYREELHKQRLEAAPIAARQMAVHERERKISEARAIAEVRRKRLAEVERTRGTRFATGVQRVRTAFAPYRPPRRQIYVKRKKGKKGKKRKRYYYEQPYRPPVQRPQPRQEETIRFF